MSEKFFDDVDTLGIVERHIRKLLRLEEDEAERVFEAYREARRELQDRLLSVRGDSFTAQQLRGTLVQVDTALAAMARGLKESMGESAELVAESGVEDLVEEIRAFEEHFRGAVVPINVDAAAIATDQKNFLFNQYEASLEAYSADLRAQLANSLTQAVIQQAPLSNVIRGMGQFFMGEEWKLHRIARTELHHAYGMGKLEGMRRLLDGQVPDLMKTLVHPMDDRTARDSKYVARLDLIVPVDQPFKYKWRGEERIYMTPPDRPNDRSIMVPYRPVWE